MDWLQYEVLAKELAIRTDEAGQRSAISRAYYCAFHIAAQYLQKKGRGFRLTGKGVDHETVWRELQIVGALAEEKNAGTKGERLRKKRNDADYKNEFPDCRSQVSLALVDVQSVLTSIRAAQMKLPGG